MLAAVGATMLLTWPAVDQETGPEKAASLYGYEGCQQPCSLEASYVTFRVDKLFSTRWDGGTDWGAAARKAGKPVESTPSVGAVAWYGGDHVAFVERVLSPDSVEITELNEHELSRRTVTRERGWPRAFILVGPRALDQPPTPAFSDSTLI